MPNPRSKPPGDDDRSIRTILMLVGAGWLLALILMGLATVFWDRQ